MSAEAVSYVYRHSPYNGATFTIHLAIADVVNDTHNNEFWMATDTVAQKTRTNRRTVQRAIDTLCNDGFMELTGKATQHRPATYRFLFPPVDIVWTSEQSGVTSDPSGVTSRTPGVTFDPSGVTPRHPNSNNSKELKEHTPSSNDSEFDTFWNIYPRKIARKKCEQWWHKHATTNAPTIIEAATAATKQWRKDNTEPRYIPHPYTWLNQERWQDPPLIAALEREERAYDIPPHQCPTCDGTRYISHQDNKGRSWATRCGDCQ